MSKRAEKAKIREIWRATFEHVADDDEAMRAACVRSLCPCQCAWEVPLWDIILAACQDASHLVRLEALHVIEDAITGDHVKDTRGLRQLYAARNDPHPDVRRFVNEVLRLKPKLMAMRNQVQRKRMRRRAERWEKAQTDL